MSRRPHFRSEVTRHMLAVTKLIQSASNFRTGNYEKRTCSGIFQGNISYVSWKIAYLLELRRESF